MLVRELPDGGLWVRFDGGEAVVCGMSFLLSRESFTRWVEESIGGELVDCPGRRRKDPDDLAWRCWMRDLLARHGIDIDPPTRARPWLASMWEWLRSLTSLPDAR